MRIRSVLCVLCLASACSRPAPAPDPAGDKPLAAAVHAYVVESLRRNPTTNTYLGGAGLDPSLHDVDGTLRDHSAAALAAEDQWLAGVRQTLTAIAPDTLSPATRIDREVTLAQVAFLLHQHRDRRYQERALDTYVIEPFRAIDWQLQGMTPMSADPKSPSYGTADEWTLVTRRVQAIPAFLERASAQLTAGVAAKNTPDRRMILRDGIGSSESTAKYFADTLPKLAAERMTGADRDTRLAALRKASAEAAAAYRAFRTFVATTYCADAACKTIKPAFAADAYAMGEADYNWALKNNLRLSENAATLFEQAWPVVESTRSQMVKLAREIGAAKHWTLPAEDGPAVRAVFDQLSKDFPKSDAEMVSWYRDAAFRLVEFARRTGLFDVPAEYKLDVTETPPPLEASIDGAAYYPAPPFKNTGVGRFYVTPTHNDLAALQSNNRAAIADLSAHEGFPGHDWYYKVMTKYRDLISPVRWLTPGAVDPRFGVQAICLRERQAHPQLMGTNRHVSCGAFDVSAVAWSGTALEDEVADGACCERRQQHATAVVAGGVEHAPHCGRRADDRQLVHRRRPQAGADLEKARRRQLGQEFRRRIEQLPDARNRRRLVEADVFGRRTHEDRSVLPRDDVAPFTPEHAGCRRTSQTQVEQLTTDWPNWNQRAWRQQIAGPASSGDHDGVGIKRRGVGDLFSRYRHLSPGERCDERGDHSGGGHISMLRDMERTSDVPESRLHQACPLRIEQRVWGTARLQPLT